MKKLLTIGIPTYNRAHSLRLMLPQLTSDLGDLVAKVEIIISDNSSQDNTQEVIQDWIKTVPVNLSIRSVRKDANIGVSKNLVSLFYLAQTPYFMFLGDDDKLNGDYISTLIEILASPNPPSAIIQGVWNSEPRINKMGFIDWHEASSLFYEYGNAWAGVIDVKAAVDAIESRGLRDAIESIVWPQTVMAYLAMYDSSPRRIFVTNKEIGSQYTGDFNLYNKQYFSKSLIGLLMAAKLIDDNIGQSLLKNKFVSYNCVGFVSHVKGIAVHSLIERGGDRTVNIQNLLKESYGVRGFIWAHILSVIDNYRLLYLAAMFFYLFIKRGNGERFDEYLSRLRASYESASTTKTKEGLKIRVGDWF